MRRQSMVDGNIRPNAAHLALARWSEWPGEVPVVTQNIDNLHEQAGLRTSCICMVRC